MNPDEYNDWKEDIKKAENTHPREFANAPFVRSFFRVSVHIINVGTHISYLGNKIERVDKTLNTTSENIKEINDSLNNASDKINRSSDQIEKLQSAGLGLTVVIALTGLIQVITSFFANNEGLIVTLGIFLAMILGIVIGFYMKSKNFRR